VSTRAFLTIGVFGMRWCVDLSALLPEHADLADTLHHLWARAAVDPNGSELPFVVARAGDAIPTDENGIARGCAFRDAIGFPYVLSRALTMASVSVRRGSALMLHAAALAVPSPAGPRGLVLVGPSGAGKSTAVRELGKRWGYLSDETAVLESDMTISPYAKPISLHSPERVPDKDEHSPDDLGLGVAVLPCPLGAVVLLQRDAAQVTPELSTLTLLDGLLAALPQTSSSQVLDRPLGRLAEALSLGGGPYLLTYSDIGACSRVLDDLVRPGGKLDTCNGEGGKGGAREVHAWSGHPPLTVNAAVGPAAGADRGADAAFVRAPWTDALEFDGQVVVLRETTPARLSGIGATIWLRGSVPFTATEMEAIVVAAHGGHPQQREKTAAAIEQLVEFGILNTARRT
jgi:hypothetical protein